jgi:hypothetical protein
MAGSWTGSVYTGDETGERVNGRGAADETIFGAGGRDTLNGLGGDDRIFGGDDADQLDGGAGDDHIETDDFQTSVTGNQNDRAFGGLGDDVIRSEYGSDLLDGGAGGVVGQLRTEIVGTRTFVYGDVDADKAVDFQIELTGKIALAVTDFLL